MLVRNNVEIRWDPRATGLAKPNGLVSISTFNCEPPPAGLVGDDTDPFNDGSEQRACFQIVNSRPVRRPPTFDGHLSVSRIGRCHSPEDGNPEEECRQVGINIDVVPCTTTPPLQNIQDLMKLERSPTPHGPATDVPTRSASPRARETQRFESP
jgi:hypothetical protein